MTMGAHTTRDRLQMVYKIITYALLIFGGGLSGALAGSAAGPIHLDMSSHELGLFGACLGGALALVGCRLAIERAEAAEQNRQLFRALDLRLSRVAHDSSHGHG
ncbi:hypothetical protein [Aquisphaera insulae]|uniref:hypothetical protein n=1 Tax=Aquisphaera insulae TaxID=2712864 RepID=UPI0013EC4040|nr:hypothetical protein [Aquisphaera insulae]